MRRKDREITDPEKIRAVIGECAVCRLGLADGKRVYVVPVNFGHVEEAGRHVLYFHGAKEGRKMDLIRQTGYPSLENEAKDSVPEKQTQNSRLSVRESDAKVPTRLPQPGITDTSIRSTDTPGRKKKRLDAKSPDFHPASANGMTSMRD